jgi:replicative DNA helicase
MGVIVVTKNQIKTTYTHLEAERALVATLFSDASARDAIFTESGILAEDRFSSRVLGAAFVALEQMFFDGADISIHSLHEHIERSGFQINEKDNNTLSEVCGVLEATSDYLTCIELIQSKYIARQSQEVLEKLSDESAAAFRGEDLSRTLDVAQQRIEALQGLLTGTKKNGSLPLAHFVTGAIDRLQQLSEREDDSPVTGVPTGVVELDNMTTGLQPGDLVIVGARPSMGKTAMLLKMADSACQHVGKNGKNPGGAVIIYSMEMLGEALANRFIAMKGRIDLQAMRTGKLSDEDMGRFVDTLERLAHFDHLCLCDQASITSAFIRADLRRKRKQFDKIAFVGIDYLGLMESPPGARINDIRANEVAGFSRDLKRIALEEKCPVVALAQLNRSLESRPNKRPLMSDLRDSGGIEQDADLITFLYRDEYYNPDTKDKGKLEIIVAKQRNGPTGVVYASYDGRYTAVDNLTGGWQ